MRAWLSAVALASLLVAACDAVPTTTTTGEPSASDSTIAQRFAPLVWLADDEEFLPMDATHFVEQSVLRFDHHGGCIDRDPVADPVDPRRLGQGGYHHQDIAPAMNPRAPCARHVDPNHATNEAPGASGFYLDPPTATRKGEGTAAPVYWERHVQQGRAAYVYWFFYGYDDLTFGNRHDADWERVAVQLDDDRPVAVTFDRHGFDPCMVPWNELERHDGHPVVYSARGSHGSYAAPGSYRVHTAIDRTSPGRQWPTAATARPVTQEPWWGYRGWWGSHKVNVPGFVGIVGPYPGRVLKGVFTDKRCEPAAESAPAELPAAFEGEWETRQPVTQTPAVPGYHMRVTLSRARSTVQYRSSWTDPDVRLECAGTLTPTAATASSVELREKIDSDRHDNCVPEGTVTLVLAGNSLKMSYASDTGSTVTGSGTLYRSTGDHPSTVPRTTEAAIGRYERFLHAVGQEDLTTVCEIAGPSAKRAEDQGFGPCESTFRVTFAMFSAEQKAALRMATVDPNLVTSRSSGAVEIPAEAVQASVRFTREQIGVVILEYRNGNWCII
jgi:hypothetical protein